MLAFSLVQVIFFPKVGFSHAVNEAGEPVIKSTIVICIHKGIELKLYVNAILLVFPVQNTSMILITNILMQLLNQKKKKKKVEMSKIENHFDFEIS